MDLDENNLAKQIQVAQEVNDTNGLTREARKLIAELNLPDCFASRIPTNEWKKLVNKSIYTKMKMKYESQPHRTRK